MNADEERQFREFVAARSRSLLHTAYLLTGDWEQGRDLLQTALASTARRWPKLREREQPEIYVRQALYHAQVDRFRLLSWGRETVTDTLPEQPCGQAADWADTVASSRTSWPRCAITGTHTGQLTSTTAHHLAHQLNPTT